MQLQHYISLYTHILCTYIHIIYLLYPPCLNNGALIVICSLFLFGIYVVPITFKTWHICQHIQKKRFQTRDKSTATLICFRTAAGRCGSMGRTDQHRMGCWVPGQWNAWGGGPHVTGHGDYGGRYGEMSFPYTIYGPVMVAGKKYIDDLARSWSGCSWAGASV